MNSFADMLPEECGKMTGALDNKVDRRPQLLKLWDTKEGLEELEKTRIEFNKWEARHKRKYGSKKEREKRFLAYLDNKRTIDVYNKVSPGFWFYGYDLENMDKFCWEASLIPIPTNYLPRKDCRHPSACLTNTKKESEEGKKAKRSEDRLCKMFLDWAKKEKKKYENEEEQEKRFKIWLSTKKYMDERHSHEPGYVFSIDYMNLFADMTLSERVMMPRALCEVDLYKGRCEVDPSEGCSPVLKLLSKTKEGLEEVRKTRIEFNEWAERHKRNYGSKEEQEKRFLAYLENKRRIDLDHKLNPGYWLLGYDLENMDKFCWEAGLIPTNYDPLERRRY